MLKAQSMAHMHLNPKAHKRPNKRGMLKNIQLGFIQDGPNPHGLLTLFKWAKEDVKI